MAKRNWVLGLVLGGCAAVAACSSDNDDNANTGGTGGTHSVAGSSSGGSAGKASGGSAGKAAGGTSAAGNAGASDHGGADDGGANNGGANNGGADNGEAGQGGEAGGGFVIPNALDPWTVLVPVAAPTTAPNHLLVAGSDFASSAEVVSVTLSPAAVGDSTTYTDQDTSPVSSGGLGFTLEATQDKVNLLDGGKVKTTFDLTDPGTATTALTANKAYVPLYNNSLISILDLASNKVSRRIDLSQFNDATDTDGSAEPSSAAYDDAKHTAYFLLQRIDRNAIAADPNFHLPCTAERGLVIGIDTTTDELVDLNGAADGKGIALTLVSPSSLSLDSTGSKLTVLASGCYTGNTLGHQGVEVVDVTAGTTSVAYAPTSADFLDGLIITSGTNALLHSFDTNFGEHWYKLDLSTGTLGAELTGVPSSVSFDGTDLLGVKVTGKVGAVVRYSISAGTSTTVTATSWTGQYSSAAGTALVQ